MGSGMLTVLTGILALEIVSRQQVTSSPLPSRPTAPNRMCNVFGDIMFVIDGSDSINDVDFVRLKNFVANLIDNFEIGPGAIHVGMVVYSTLVGETIDLNSDQNKKELKRRARNLKHPKSGTNTAAGIEAAREMIDGQGRPQAPEIIIVITDGRSTDPRNTILQANAAKTDEITLLAMGVGQDIFQTELDKIASNPNLVSVVKDFRSLSEKVYFIRNLVCTSLRQRDTTPPTPKRPTVPALKQHVTVTTAASRLSVSGSCDKRPHWDKRYYFQIKNGLGKVLRQCPVGKVYVHEECGCTEGIAGLVP